MKMIHIFEKKYFELKLIFKTVFIRFSASTLAFSKCSDPFNFLFGAFLGILEIKESEYFIKQLHHKT